MLDENELSVVLIHNYDFLELCLNLMSIRHVAISHFAMPEIVNALIHPVTFLFQNINFFTKE